MKILVHLDFLGLGGHLLSAAATCLTLKERGHEITIAGDFDLLEPKLRQAGLDLVRIPVGLDRPDGPVLFPPRFDAVVEELDRIAAERGAEVIQLFQYYNLPAARRVALRRDIPVVLTLCGGKPVDIVGISDRETVVFSAEQAEYYARHGHLPRERIHLIPQRVDLTLADRRFETLPPAILSHLEDPGPKVLMITRLNAAKTPAAQHVIAALEQLRPSFPDLKLLLAGAGSEARRIERIAQDHVGTAAEGLVVPLGRVVDAFRLVPHVDVVLGSGRCVFEAMVFRKPSLVVGATGYAGAVEPGSVAALAHFNFAGRNAPDPVPAGDLAAKVGDLLRDPDLRRRQGEFGRAYAESHLDMRLAGPRYEDVYRLAIDRHARPDTWVDDSLAKIEADDAELRRRFRRDRLRKTVRSVVGSILPSQWKTRRS